MALRWLKKRMGKGKLPVSSSAAPPTLRIDFVEPPQAQPPRLPPPPAPVSEGVDGPLPSLTLSLPVDGDPASVRFHKLVEVASSMVRQLVLDIEDLESAVTFLEATYFDGAQLEQFITQYYGDQVASHLFHSGIRRMRDHIMAVEESAKNVVTAAYGTGIMYMDFFLLDFDVRLTLSEAINKLDDCKKLCVRFIKLLGNHYSVTDLVSHLIMVIGDIDTYTPGLQQMLPPSPW